MDMQNEMVDHLVGQVIEYCTEYQILWNMDVDDRGVEFTFKSDLIAHRVKHYVNSRYIVRDGSQLFIERKIYDNSPEINLIPRKAKIQNILIAIVIMLGLYGAFFIWILK